MTLTVLSVAYSLAPAGPDAVGGSEQVLAAIDAALVRAGHRSIVVACEGSSASGTLLAVPAETGVLDEAAMLRGAERNRVAIAGALERYPIDLVHLHGIDFYRYIPDTAPTLVTLHLNPEWYPADFLNLRRDHYWLHCVSRTQHGMAPAGAGLLPPIPNGVDIEALSVRHAKRNFALFLGRICPDKGVHIAMDAAAKARCPLIMAGQVFRYEWHERYFRDEVVPRLGPKCRFIGAVAMPRKRRFLAAARCLVLSSTVPETSSLVAMEAMASGTPVVAFPVGALPEIVDHGRTGFLVNDVDEMAAAIEAAGDLDPDLCRAQARARFSLRRMTESYLARYQALLEDSSARRAARASF